MFSGACMNATEAGIRFPVIAFTADADMWGMSNLGALTSCGRQTLKDGLQIGMEIVDADGRRWVVRSVRRIGRNFSWLALLFLTTWSFRIEQELDALEPMSLAEVQERVCASMIAHPENLEPEYAHEEEDFARILPPRLAEVRATTSIAELYEILGLDTFEPY
jgi:hypothetical protein